MFKATLLLVQSEVQQRNEKDIARETAIKMNLVMHFN